MAAAHQIVNFPAADESPASVRLRRLQTVNPALFAAGAIALDLMLMGFVARALKRRMSRAQPFERKKHLMTSTALMAIAAGLGGLYLLSKKKTPALDRKAVIEARYKAAMTAPTYDWNYYKNEIEFFKSQGELGLANNVMLRMQDLQKQVAAAKAK